MKVTYFTSSITTRVILFYLMMFSALALGFAGNVIVGAIVALPLLLAAMMGASVSFPILETQSKKTTKNSHLSMS